jgi:hypothetical protein
MSPLRRSVWALAVLLAVPLGSATPAAARPGIWIYLRDGQSWSISLINLTQQRLLITKNSFSLSCVQDSHMPYQCAEYQSNPFQGHGTLNLDSYRTATWKSHSAESDGGFAWAGSFSVKPEGMDAWEVSINTHKEDAHCCFNPGWGTWVYLQTDFSATGNPEWSTAWNAFAYGIWVAPDFVTDYAHMESVMTLSGTQLAVSLYSPDNHHVVVVLRETFWDGHEGADYSGWRLRYVDAGSTSVP